MLAQALAVVTLLVTALLTYYLRRVSDSRSCPRCGATLTHARPDAGAIGAKAWLSWGDPARCSNCDWSGRMRRDAVEPVRLWAQRREGTP